MKDDGRERLFRVDLLVIEALDIERLEELMRELRRYIVLAVAVVDPARISERLQGESVAATFELGDEVDELLAEVVGDEFHGGLLC